MLNYLCVNLYVEMFVDYLYAEMFVDYLDVKFGQKSPAGGRPGFHGLESAPPSAPNSAVGPPTAQNSVGIRPGGHNGWRCPLRHI